jgi:hypothetical protein
MDEHGIVRLLARFTCFAATGDTREELAPSMLDWKPCPTVERFPGKVSGVWLFKGTLVAVKALFVSLPRRRGCRTQPRVSTRGFNPGKPSLNRFALKGREMITW